MSEFLIDSSTQLTVQQLLDCLAKLVKKNPELKNALVYHVEFGGITPSHSVELTTETDKYDENEKVNCIVINQ
jgi:hypothetical protein